MVASLTLIADDRELPEDDHAEEREHWNGKGHIEFLVVQNAPDIFEVEMVDYSGCAGGLQETLGIEYYITDIWCLHKGSEPPLLEGGTYTLNGVTAEWTRGDGWTTDDDVEYSFETITQKANEHRSINLPQSNNRCAIE
jgi:hypothetical protein